MLNLQKSLYRSYTLVPPNTYKFDPTMAIPAAARFVGKSGD
jgi:hypothetical protein